MTKANYGIPGGYDPADEEPEEVEHHVDCPHHPDNSDDLPDPPWCDRCILDNDDGFDASCGWRVWE